MNCADIFADPPQQYLGVSMNCQIDSSSTADTVKILINDLTNPPIRVGLAVRLSSIFIYSKNDALNTNNPTKGKVVLMTTDIPPVSIEGASFSTVKYLDIWGGSGPSNGNYQANCGAPLWLDFSGLTGLCGVTSVNIEMLSLIHI